MSRNTDSKVCITTERRAEDTGRRGIRDKSNKIGQNNNNRHAIVRVCQLRMIGWLITLSPPVSSAGRFATGSRQQQRRCHFPPLLHQQIERPARRADIHHLEPDAFLRERAANRGRRKLLHRARAEQHQLR
jgi:hypothetical protein